MSFNFQVIGFTFLYSSPPSTYDLPFCGDTTSTILDLGFGEGLIVKNFRKALSEILRICLVENGGNVKLMVSGVTAMDVCQLQFSDETIISKWLAWFYS